MVGDALKAPKRANMATAGGGGKRWCLLRGRVAERHKRALRRWKKVPDRPRRDRSTSEQCHRGSRTQYGAGLEKKIEESFVWSKKSTCQNARALLFFWRRADVTAPYGAARSTSCFVKELCNGREEDRQEDRCQGERQERLRHQVDRQEGQGLGAAGTLWGLARGKQGGQAHERLCRVPKRLVGSQGHTEPSGRSRLPSGQPPAGGGTAVAGAVSP